MFLGVALLMNLTTWAIRDLLIGAERGLVRSGSVSGSNYLTESQYLNPAIRAQGYH